MAGPIDPRDDTLFLRLQSSYAAAVSYLDAGVGRLVEDLGDRADDVVLLITSDSGQQLGEHGGVPGVSGIPRDAAGRESPDGDARDARGARDRVGDSAAFRFRSNPY